MPQHCFAAHTTRPTSHAAHRYARWLRQGIPETRKGVIAEATKALQKKSVPSATFSFSKDFAAAFDSVHNRGTVPVLLM